MEKERKRKLMWRWSLITAGLIALFWTMWYLITGQVPVMTSIKMTPELTWQLPFGISRWWDILIGPIWSFILYVCCSSFFLVCFCCLFVFGCVCVFFCVFFFFLEGFLKKRFWKSVG